ncbi:MAG TPA: ATP-dependent metallopeptidase FtsH/Yme1/Tma family protein, partial [Polyangiaceae bacterium]|nr:ATP-dependent metallopeptidase FtsH/Yme1/Tma family protein [Polyangiaceae bacterium]
MSEAIPNPPSRQNAPNVSSGDPQPSMSWQMLVLLAALLAGMWFWRASVEGQAHPGIDYSAFYGWLEAGKIESVVLRGPILEGSLKAPEKVGDTPTKVFHTVRPERDDALLPLLREKKVDLRVENEQQPFAVQLVLSLLPWALIIGVWVWLSRRAQKMMAGGGPLGGILKTKSRR